MGIPFPPHFTPTKIKEVDNQLLALVAEQGRVHVDDHMLLSLTPKDEATGNAEILLAAQFREIGQKSSIFIQLSGSNQANPPDTKKATRLYLQSLQLFNTDLTCLVIHPTPKKSNQISVLQITRFRNEKK